MVALDGGRCHDESREYFGILLFDLLHSYASIQRGVGLQVADHFREVAILSRQCLQLSYFDDSPDHAVIALFYGSPLQDIGGC